MFNIAQKNSILKPDMKEAHQMIVNKAEKLVREERRITTEILECLHEIDSKMIYAEMAYSSLYEFCVKHLKYSEGSAHRRISAMRLLKSLPESTKEEAKAKIESGSVSVTNLSLLQGFLKIEKKETGKVYSAEEKSALIQNIENRSKLEIEKQLAAIQPQIIPRESKRVLTESLTEIKFVADESLMKKFQRIYEISSHALPDASMVKMINRMADDYLKRHDPMLKLERVKIKSEKVVQ